MKVVYHIFYTYATQSVCYDRPKIILKVRHEDTLA